MLHRIRNIIAGCMTVLLISCASTGGITSLNKRLVRAAEGGNTGEVVALLKAGADIEARDSEGFTPYLAAASHGHFETMKLLRGLGAKTMVDEKFEDGRFVVKAR